MTHAINLTNKKSALRPSRNGKNPTRWVVAVLRALFNLGLILFILWVNDEIVYDIAWYGIFLIIIMLLSKGENCG